MTIEHLGAVGDGFSPIHKVHILQKRAGNDVNIWGLLPGAGEGTITHQSNWTSPFEGDDIGSKFSKVGALLQEKTGSTLVTTLSSTQVWQGSAPVSFELPLRLIASTDPIKDVMAPLRALVEMLSPELEAKLPFDVDFDSAADLIAGNSSEMFGRVPASVAINIGQKFMYPRCKIENLSHGAVSEKDENGNFIRLELNLTIQTLSTLNRSEIKGLHGNN